MERFLHPIVDPRSRVSRNISVRAARLARSGARPDMMVEDIAQDLREHLWRRDNAFDPSRGIYDTFADRVLANRIATLAAPTERLRAERATVAFETPAGDGDRATLAETLSDGDVLYAAGQRPADETMGLVRDVRRFLDGLTPACRAVAHALIDLTPTETAEALGLHRSTVYARLSTIRAAAAALGLDAWLGATPTYAPPGR